jgi:hypothetical protein
MATLLEALLIFAWTVTFATAGIWSQISNAPFPLPGLRHLAEADRLNIALQVATVLVAAALLAFRSWQTRMRLMVFVGVAFVLFLLGCLFIGVPYGLAFACFGGIARSRVTKAPAMEKSL